ncbi:MAG: universal stress protein, partial [Actinomycetota bacterium]|nr:universal stress protein [Actinomycetota bacterium]
MAQRIVVGIDGSEPAKLATRWAATEAQLRGATLELITTWDVPIYPGTFGVITTPDELLKELAKEAEERLAQAAEEVRAVAGDVEIET